MNPSFAFSFVESQVESLMESHGSEKIGIYTMHNCKRTDLYISYFFHFQYDPMIASQQESICYELCHSDRDFYQLRSFYNRENEVTTFDSQMFRSARGRLFI